METTSKASNNRTLVKRDQSCIWHPFTQMLTAGEPIPIVSAKGAYLVAEGGRKYLDGISSWWVNLHGHAHPYIAEKIRVQASVLEHVIFANFTHRPAVDLAERLLEILPGSMSKIFYSDNGSTAVEAALKMALQYWHNQNPETTKTKVVCFRHSYHGDTFGAMSAAGRNDFNRPFWKHLFEVEVIDPPVPGSEERVIKELKAVLTKGETACFIFEPLILGVGGMIIYPAASLDALLKLCREYDVVTIADEVMTGFGRTGPLFACDQLTEKPDIICLAKGLTGGFLPLGVTACQEKIYQAFLSENLLHALLHGHSYTANPIACSSALASLDLLQEVQCTKARERIANCHANFCKKWKHHPRLRRCESLGTILVVEYRTEQATSYFNSLRHRLYRFFLDHNTLLRPFGNTVHVLPPYCITTNELHEIYALIAHTLEANI